MMTIGGTVIAMRGTLKRWSTSMATSPMAKAAKKAAGASIIPISFKTKRRPFAPKANRPTANTVRAELLNSIAKAEPATKLATARSNSFNGYAGSSGGCRDKSIPATAITMLRPKRDRQQNHYAVRQAAHGGDSLQLQ